MTTLRRNILKTLLLGSGLWVFLGSAKYSFAKERINSNAMTTFRHFLDTLIPEDGSPSATQINLDNVLLDQAMKIQNYEKLIFLGCQWLDLQSNAFYKKTFTDLNTDQKDRVVGVASKSHPDSIPAQFFIRLRRDSFTFYYANPSSWTGLKFSGPPQPYGHFDYQESPKIK
jgi:hypothetical protein